VFRGHVVFLSKVEKVFIDKHSMKSLKE